MRPADIVITAIQKLSGAGLKQAEIGRKLGIGATMVTYYLNGMPTKNGGVETPRPNSDLLMKALALIGGDISRALPDYEPAGQSPLSILGDIEAGAAVQVFEEEVALEGIDDIWKRSSLFSKSFGPIKYLRVHGDSMAPDYPEGCLIPVRRTTIKAQNFPDFSPVILEDIHRQEMSFKLLQVEHSRKGDKSIRAIVGNPINRAHRALIFKPDEVRVVFVVLGKIEPAVPSIQRQNKAAALLKGKTARRTKNRKQDPPKDVEV